MKSGYSKRSLLEKLEIKTEMKICILNQPDDYSKTLGSLPQPLTTNYKLLATTKYDFIQYFTKSQEALREDFPRLKQSLQPNGMLWISWPKGACSIATDLNENIIRSFGLKNGLVDVKVISVDEVWSGLKFVYRLKDR